MKLRERMMNTSHKDDGTITDNEDMKNSWMFLRIDPHMNVCLKTLSVKLHVRFEIAIKVVSFLSPLLEHR